MSPATEPCLQLIKRSYCYLRLSGIEETKACNQLRVLLEHLDSIDTDLDETQAQRDALWQHILDYVAAHATTDITCAKNPLALRRGHIRYPNVQG